MEAVTCRNEIPFIKNEPKLPDFRCFGSFAFGFFLRNFLVIKFVEQDNEQNLVLIEKNLCNPWLIPDGKNLLIFEKTIDRFYFFLFY